MYSYSGEGVGLPRAGYFLIFTVYCMYSNRARGPPPALICIVFKYNVSFVLKGGILVSYPHI